MPATAQEVYSEAVLALPRPERLRLAALILQDLTRSEESEDQPVELGDAWSREDEADVTAYSLRAASEAYPDAERL